MSINLLGSVGFVVFPIETVSNQLTARDIIFLTDSGKSEKVSLLLNPEDSDRVPLNSH